MKKNLLKTLLCIILLLLAAVLGKVIGEAAADISYLSWLAIGANFGFSPTVIDLAVIQVTLGFMLSINMAQIILILVAIFIYTRVKIRD